MPETINNDTDHNNLITLIADVRNMKEGQDDFHQEMKGSFKELKENFANRLCKVEDGWNNADKVYAAKAEEDKKDVGFNKRIGWLEKVCYTCLGVVSAVEFYYRVIK